MSQKPRSRRPKPGPPASTGNSKTPIMYIIVVSVVVFSMLLAGLAAVDWSSILPNGSDPTPDYNIDQIALQQTVVAQNPDDVEAQALLASLLANTGRIQEAIPVFEKAIELDPDNAKIRLDFARSLQSNNLSADAEAQFLKVLELEPDNHTAHYYLAQLYMDWQPHRQDEAVEHFNRVLEIAPNSFLADQSQIVLDSLAPGTPTTYEVTPISSPLPPQ